jgi:predicted lactoylglutathione lyase
MNDAPLIVALPTADRQVAYAFYKDGLGFEPIGEPADDGVPEPLQFELNEGARLMFIPTGGFGWVTGDHETAAAGTSEVLLSHSADSPAEVDATLEQASTAGARIVSEPEQKPWGYTGLFADPDGHLWEVIAR